MTRSEAIKQGIAISKKRGTAWGSNGAAIAKHNREVADQFAKQLEPVIFGLLLSAKGRRLIDVATELNRLGHRTTQGSYFRASTVSRIINRFGPLFQHRLTAERKARSKAYQATAKSTT